MKYQSKIRPEDFINSSTYEYCKLLEEVLHNAKELLKSGVLTDPNSQGLAGKKTEVMIQGIENLLK